MSIHVTLEKKKNQTEFEAGVALGKQEFNLQGLR